MTVTGCYDSDGAFVPTVSADQENWFDRQYEEIRSLRGTIPEPEYQRRLDELCREIMEREG